MYFSVPLPPLKRLMSRPLLLARLYVSNWSGMAKERGEKTSGPSYGAQI